VKGERRDGEGGEKIGVSEERRGGVEKGEKPPNFHMLLQREEGFEMGLSC